jgi:formiminotetrahydrofolate cyclodeaminase
MPPSGFSQKAINGLLEFVKANYQTIAENYSESSLTEKEFLEKTSNELEKQVKNTLIEKFPSDNLNGGIEGLTTFVTECYRDLAKEVMVGKDKYDRSVIDGKAIQKELSQIRTYLTKFKL